MGTICQMNNWIVLLSPQSLVKEAISRIANIFLKINGMELMVPQLVAV